MGREWEERVNSSLSSLEGGMARFEERMQERVMALENGVNKKMENMYKTLTVVFEHLNELQGDKLTSVRKEGRVNASMKLPSRTNPEQRP